jgi:hypothetical protein
VSAASSAEVEQCVWSLCGTGAEAGRSHGARGCMEASDWTGCVRLRCDFGDGLGTSDCGEDLRILYGVLQEPMGLVCEVVLLILTALKKAVLSGPEILWSCFEKTVETVELAAVEPSPR